MPVGMPVFASFQGTMIVTSADDNKIWNRTLHFGFRPKGKTQDPRMMSYQPITQPPSWTQVSLVSRGIFDEKVDSDGTSQWEFFVQHCGTGPLLAVCGTLASDTVQIWIDATTLMQVLR
jgi:hypothetical protein